MKKILIVEDDAAQRMLYEAEISALGFIVTVVDSGEAALKAVKADRPDLVLLDIMMPGMSGLDTLREILKDTPPVPVIINSAYSHYKDSFMSWAAEEYIVKSSDLTELKIAVEKIINQ